MGCGPSQMDDEDATQIKVATLNYSGILLSPYQFYENNDAQERKLNQKMKKISQQYNLVYQFGPFDRDWQKKRYSPLYIQKCGIKNNNEMMNKKQFLQQWNNWQKKHEKQVQQIYQIQKKKVQDNEKKKKQFLSKQQFLQNLRKFDMAAYRVVLEYVYQQTQSFNQIITNFDHEQNKLKITADKYIEHRKKKFSKAFLDENKKIQKTLKALQFLRLDILFLQEASTQLVDQIEKSSFFKVVKLCKPNSKQIDAKSIIVIRTTKFPKIKSLQQQNSRIINIGRQAQSTNSKKLSAQQISQLNFNKDSVFQCIYNLILVCPHLTSKKQRNEQQMNQLVSKIKLLKKYFPDCYVIVGGDLNNGKFKPFKFESVTNSQSNTNSKNNQIFINIVPDCQANFTAYKKRTQLQVQKNKADTVTKQAKDYIITDLQIKSAKITTVLNDLIAQCKIKQVSQIVENSQTIYTQKRQTDSDISMLPTDRHPYDHFMVSTTIKLPNKGKLQHITDKSYIYKYNRSQLSQNQIKQIEESMRTIKS